jgi:homoserine O-succinyltransferase/O-acetyltransferase
MPIKLADDIPAFAALAAEGVMVMRDSDAVRQDIRPLKVGLLNLMPNKIRTETQIARLVAATPLQVEMTLIRVSSHAARNTPLEHMTSFYRPWQDVREESFDGLIVTGAPVEHLDFEAVTYWRELQSIFDWTQNHVHRTLTICWAAQAALHHFYGLPKHRLAEKAFGVFHHHNLAPTSPYLRGFSDDFAIPVSRWTETRCSDLPKHSQFAILAESDETGLCLLNDPHHRMLHMFNHIEYDATSLAEEYVRDSANGMPLPRNYFPGDNVNLAPRNNWRSHAHLLFGNWINEVYQTAPFKLSARSDVVAEP